MGKSIFRWVAILTAMLVFAACGSGPDSFVRNVAAPDFDEPGSFTDFGQYNGEVDYMDHDFKLAAPDEYPSPGDKWLGEKYLSPSFECKSDRLTVSMNAKTDVPVTEEQLALLDIELDETFSDFALARYKYNGKPESYFGDDGMVVADVGLTYFGLPEGPWTPGYTVIPGLFVKRHWGSHLGKHNSGLLLTESHIYGWGKDGSGVHADSRLVRLTNLGRPDQSFGSNGQLAIPFRPLVALATFDFDNLKVGVVSLNGNGYLGHMELRRENGNLLGLLDFTSDGDFESLSVPQVLDPSPNGPGTYLLDIAAQDENFFVLMHESAALRIYKYSLVPKPGGSGALDIVKDDSFTTEMPDIVGITLQDDANLLVDGEYIYVSYLPSLSAVPNRVYRVSIDGGLDTDWGDGGAVKTYRQTNQTGLEMFPSPSGGVDVYSANTSGALPYGELPVKVTRLNNSGSVVDEQSFSVGPEDERIGFGLPHLGGHLLVFGEFEDTDVMRVNSWGEIDTSFADSYGGELDFVSFTSMKPLPDGSAVGIGSLRHSSSDAVVVKIDPEGNLDDSFGGEDAYRTLDRIADVTLDGGRIFVVGNSQVNIGGPKRLWSIGAFGIDGKLDPDFGDHGLATIARLENSSANAVAIDGRYIYLAGNSGMGTPAVVRFHRNGELDTAFGLYGSSGFGGTAVEAIAGRNSGANAIAIDRYQRPTIGGYVRFGNVRYPALQRYTGSGEPDPAFGTKGAVFKKVGLGGEIHDLVVQPNQSIVAVGHVDTPSGSDILVMRYKPNGKLDPTFGKGGRVITDLGTKGDRANAVTLDRHGRIVVTGVTGGSDTDFVTLRYASDGKPDSTFGKYGVVTTNLGSPFEEATDVKIDVNQRIVVSGTTGKDDDAVFAVMRYLPNGDPDPDFEGNPYDLPGSVTTDIGVGAEHANGLVLLKNQLPIVVGSSIGAEWNELFPDYNVTIEGYFASAQKLGTKTTAQQAGTTADQLTLDIMYSTGNTKAVFLHVIRDEDTAEFEGAVQTTMYVEFDGPPSNRTCAVSMNFASTYKQPWK